VVAGKGCVTVANCTLCSGEVYCAAVKRTVLECTVLNCTVLCLRTSLPRPLPLTLSPLFPLYQQHAHHGAVFDIKWGQCDGYLLTASGDGTVKVCSSPFPSAFPCSLFSLLISMHSLPCALIVTCSKTHSTHIIHNIRRSSAPYNHTSHHTKIKSSFISHSYSYKIRKPSYYSHN
jgi:hypothetical protein